MHHLVAAYLGYEPRDAAEEAKRHEQELHSVLAAQPVVHDAPRVDSAAWDAFAKTPAAVA